MIAALSPPRSTRPEPHSLVWVRVLRRFPAANRLQIALAEAVTEFPRGTLATWAEKVGRSRATVCRVMSDPQWTAIHNAYLLQRKDLCRDDFRLAMEFAGRGIVARQQKAAAFGSEYKLTADEISLLKLHGQWTGEIGSDVQVAVVNQGGDVNITQIVADAQKRMLATQPKRGSDLQDSTAQADGGELETHA